MQHELPLTLNMNQQYSQQNLYVPPSNGRIKSENDSDRAVSPHASEHSSRYSSQTPQNSMAYQQIASHLSNGMRYPSPSQLQQQNMPMIQHTYRPNAPSDPGYQHMVQDAVEKTMGQIEKAMAKTTGGVLPKAFACSTCTKGFARRSDLARHERIHSGVRPHVCDHPGCGKMFIQRSALTVHSRVHSGEKPHMCERCSKPFSDSSSLARHRRIHSGKRPYKCPYADCQKTFTRRTTLTRHQNHHTGTIEESEAATAAALTSRVSMQPQRSRGSDDENEYSGDAKSPMSQQPDRPSSTAPGASMNGIPIMQRQASDYYMNAMNGGMAAVPQHLRSEMQPSPRAQSPAQYPMPLSNNQQHRSSLTSNPAVAYNPPQILEPPPTNGQSHGGSGNGSPHVNSGMGWQSPHNGLNGQHHGDYSYPHPNQGYSNVSAPQLYYQSQAGVQRPHSTGPMDYSTQLRSHEMWAQHQQ